MSTWRVVEARCRCACGALQAADEQPAEHEQDAARARPGRPRARRAAAAGARDPGSTTSLRRPGCSARGWPGAPAPGRTATPLSATPGRGERRARGRRATGSRRERAAAPAAAGSSSRLSIHCATSRPSAAAERGEQPRSRSGAAGPAGRGRRRARGARQSHGGAVGGAADEQAGDVGAGRRAARCPTIGQQHAEEGR